MKPQIYNWQLSDWPDFKYQLTDIEDTLILFAEQTGHVSGTLKALPENVQLETIIDVMVAEAIKTSAIEGEYLNRKDVMTSIRNKMGLNAKRDIVIDKKAQWAGELMVIVRNTFDSPLSEEVLFSWHKLLMQKSQGITVGQWRNHKEPMLVVSGAIGKGKIHFEAPPSNQVPREMKRFIKWFNDTMPGGKKEIKKAPVRAAIAHLYFESIHPFEDGNGRIGRAIAEKALAQTLGRPILLSLSQTIDANKKDYYSNLEKAQRSNIITSWITYFVKTIYIAQLKAKDLIELTLRKAKFFNQFKELLNERQLKAIKKMMDAEPEGFEGGMTANKYTSITNTSKATATRDLQSLIDLEILKVVGGGRSTHYYLNF
jgi:Fic family protein